MSEGILLPGWSCTSCGAFNGSAKEHRTTCRICDEVAPPTLAEVLVRTVPHSVGLALALVVGVMHERRSGEQFTADMLPLVVAELDRAFANVLEGAGLYVEMARWRVRGEWDAHRRMVRVGLIAVDATAREPEHPKTVPAPPPSGPIIAGD